MTVAVLATIVFLHGGAWQSGDKADYDNLVKTFASQHVKVIAANYRLSNVAQHPAPIDDLEKTLAGIKDDKIVLMGHSAGAHMIAFWNTAHANPRVRGFIGIEGIYDIPSLIKVWPGYKDWFITKEFGGPEKWAAASPTQLKMKSRVPWLVIQSEKDELVDVKQSTDFVESLRRQLIPAELVKLKAESHFGAIKSLEDPSSEASKAVMKFISKI